MNPRIREKESHWAQAFWANYIIVLHAIAAVAISLLMLTVVDGKLVAFNSEEPWFRRRYLQAEDITTAVSTAITGIRIITGAWAIRSAWRCALILLETQGITLRQFHRIVSWPAYFLRGSTDAYIAAVVLLLLVPANIVSPVITGSVGWKGAGVKVAAEDFQYTGPAIIDNGEWFWYLRNSRTGPINEVLVQHAVSRAGIGWLDRGGGNSRSSRLVTTSPQEMPVNSTISNLTLPFLKIHSISWDRKTDFWKNITDELDPSVITDSSLTLSRKEPFSSYHLGNAILFDEHFLDNLPSVEITDTPQQAPIPLPTSFNGTKKVAVLVGRQWMTNCSPLAETIFGNKTSMARIQDLYSGKHTETPSENCFLIGTVYFTAGVIRKEATYIMPRVVEAEADSPATILKDNWVIESLYLLPDVMTKVSMVNVSQIPTWDNLDGYLEDLIRISYQATWGVLSSRFNTEPLSSTVEGFVPRLQAVVSRPRVIAWYCAQVLVLVSAVLLSVLQRRSSRPISIDTGVVALLVDASPILNKYDATQELSRISYVTRRDGGTVRLAECDVSDTGSLARRLGPYDSKRSEEAPLVGHGTEAGKPPTRYMLVPQADGG